MIFENYNKSIFCFLMCNQLLRYYVYSNYSNFSSIEEMRITILKFTLILPIIALLHELMVAIKNYTSNKKFRHGKLKNQIVKIKDSNQKKYTIINNGIFIIGIVALYLLNDPEISRQYTLHLFILNLIILELYFILNSFNNIKIRNGIYNKGIYSMGSFYKWIKIDDIKVKKEKKEIYIVRKIPLFGNVTKKVRYTDEKVLKHIKKKLEINKL